MRPTSFSTGLACNLIESLAVQSSVNDILQRFSGDCLQIFHGSKNAGVEGKKAALDDIALEGLVHKNHAGLVVDYPYDKLGMGLPPYVLTAIELLNASAKGIAAIGAARQKAA